MFGIYLVLKGWIQDFGGVAERLRGPNIKHQKDAGSLVHHLLILLAKFVEIQIKLNIVGNIPDLNLDAFVSSFARII